METLTITVNAGKHNETEQVVRPISTVGLSTLVLYIDRGRVGSKWVQTSRIHPMPTGKE